MFWARYTGEKVVQNVCDIQCVCNIIGIYISPSFVGMGYLANFLTKCYSMFSMYFLYHT